MPVALVRKFFLHEHLSFMANKKSEPKNLALYTQLMSVVPKAEIKGDSMPYTSMNGNMYSFLKEGSVALRLGQADREEFIEKFKSKLFEAYSAVMKEYVTITPALLKKTKELKPYARKSFEYAQTLKAKATKKK
jgi:hypothetical protein